MTFNTKLWAGVAIIAVTLILSNCGQGGTGPVTGNDTSSGHDPGSISHPDAHRDPLEDNYLHGWDTGTGAEGCAGEFMTADECLAVKGSWEGEGSLPIETNICDDGQFKRCCVPNVLTNPCPYECMGAAECTVDRGGQVTPWDIGHQCPDWSLDCCQGAAPLESDTSQFMGEIFDPDTDCPIPPEDVITSEDQPDTIASGICTELMDENSPFFCPQEDYQRIVRDIAAIKAAYPVTAADRGGQIFNGFGEEVLPFAIMCVPGHHLKNCNDFPKGQWEDILGCFGAQYEECLFHDEVANTCGIPILNFDLGVNTKRMMSYFEEHAKGLIPGSLCELDGYYNLTYPLNGFHIEKDFGDGTWLWAVRSTAMFELSTAHCDVHHQLITHSDSPDITEIKVENLSDESCQLPEFK